MSYFHFISTYSKKVPQIFLILSSIFQAFIRNFFQTYLVFFPHVFQISFTFPLNFLVFPSDLYKISWRYTSADVAHLGGENVHGGA